MTQLAIVRLMGADRVQLVGFLAGGLRPRHVGEDDEETELEPEQRRVAPADVAGALDREDLDSLTLEEPAELVRIEGFAEGPVAGGGGYVTHYLVSMLPFGHQVVYLDMVAAVAVVPVEPLDGAETEGVVAAYQSARQRQAQGAGGKERKRVRL